MGHWTTVSLTQIPRQPQADQTVRQRTLRDSTQDKNTPGAIRWRIWLIGTSPRALPTKGRRSRPSSALPPSGIAVRGQARPCRGRWHRHSSGSNRARPKAGSSRVGRSRSRAASSRSASGRSATGDRSRDRSGIRSACWSAVHCRRGTARSGVTCRSAALAWPRKCAGNVATVSISVRPPEAVSIRYTPKVASVSFRR